MFLIVERNIVQVHQLVTVDGNLGRILMLLDVATVIRRVRWSVGYDEEKFASLVIIFREKLVPPVTLMTDDFFDPW